MVAYSPLSLTTITDGTGRPLVGAQVSIFDAGTLTPRTVYADAALNVPLPQPILTPASGRIPGFWTTGNPYRARLVTSDGVLLEDIDGIQGDVGTSGGGGGGGGGTSDLVTGDTVWSYRSGARANFVRCNGRTIGSAVSGGTELADPSCQALFAFLWNATTFLAVSGGRGSTANGDWLANKTIALPDLRFGAPFGLDDMGNTASGRAVGATFGMGSGGALGSFGGKGAETLDATQIPSHTHIGQTDQQGAHQHGGFTAAAGNHVHGGTTDTQGDHAHPQQGPASTSGSASGSVVGYWYGGPNLGLATGTAGAHMHNFYTAAAGDHYHSIVTDVGGNHAHFLNIANTGGGLSHNNMPGFVLGTWYMRL